MGVQAPGQALAVLLLRDDHPVHPQLFQHPAVGLVMGLAHNIGYAQLLQVHGGEYGGSQIVADGNDGAVEVPHPQGAEDLLILGISHHRVGHLVCHLLHQLAAYIQGQHLRPQAAKLPGNGGTEPAQADHNIVFHGMPPIR